MRRKIQTLQRRWRCAIVSEKKLKEKAKTAVAAIKRTTKKEMKAEAAH